MTDISVIIPVHEFNDTIGEQLKKGLVSLQLQRDVEIPKVIVVYTHLAEQSGLLDFLGGFTGLTVTSILNQGKTDFCSQVNFGVKQTDTPYFSILEFDDEYSINYFRNVRDHIKVYPDVGLFLPFTVDVDFASGNIVQMVNQTIWSKGYVGENGVLGFLNAKAVADYSYYTLGGGVFKKIDYEVSGGLKSNIKLAFTYEFILRFLENGNKIYSLSKFGYKHIINRSGSLFANYAATMSDKEKRFWFQTAKKECHFATDRVIDTTSLQETAV